MPRLVRDVLPLSSLLASVAGALLLARYLPGQRVLPWPWNLAGLLPVAVALAVEVVALRLLIRQRTTFRPAETPSRLVTTGLYGRSRNPIYVGHVLLTLGTALLAGSLTALAAPVLHLAALNSLVVPYEERRLNEAFGPEFEEYCRKVGRWL